MKGLQERPAEGSRSGFRCCLLVPTYNNPATLRAVVTAGRAHLDSVIVVDDGSGSEGRTACEQVQREGLAQVHHRERNGGKGAAVKTGFEVARAQGFTHVLQVDADGQHDLSSVPAFLQAAERQPETLVLGYPRYDETAPLVRRWARKFTDFWVNLEAGKGVIRDAMVGFRVYPLQPLTRVPATGDRMDFDIEIAVRAAWAHIPIVNLPVAVRYLAEEEGGVSHFQPLRDNLRFARMHSALCISGCVGWVLKKLRLR